MYIIPRSRKVPQNLVLGAGFYLAQNVHIVLLVDWESLGNYLSVPKYQEIGLPFSLTTYHDVVYSKITRKQVMETITSFELEQVVRYFMSLREDEWEALHMQNIMENGPLTHRWWIRSAHNAISD